MARLLLVATAIVIVGSTRTDAVAQDRRPSPWLQDEMDRAQKQVEKDKQGPLAKEAVVACRRVAGISAPVQTGREALQAGYSVETAIKFGDCVTNYMYPVDAKETEELDRKANRR